MQYVGHSSKIVQIQVQMAERALELLILPDDTSCYVLDVGCLCVGVALA